MRPKSAAPALVQVVPLERCVSTVRKRVSTSAGVEAEWAKRNIFPCATYVSMAVQVRPSPRAAAQGAVCRPTLRAANPVPQPVRVPFHQ